MNPGLTQAKAAELLKQYGYNELPGAKPRNTLQIAIEIIKEPMFILLLSCGGIYLLLGDYTEGIVMMVSVFVVIFITFYQNRKIARGIASPFLSARTGDPRWQRNTYCRQRIGATGFSITS
jgi:Ca2+-transporting ATPase